MNTMEAMARILKMEGVELISCFPSNNLIEAAAKEGIRPIMFRQERGALMAEHYGAEGDATVLRMDEGVFTFTDSYGVSVEAKQRLNHVLTIRRGSVYRPYLR